MQVNIFAHGGVNMGNHRVTRIGEEIKRELAQMIRDDIKDPRVKGLISITNVDVTNDLRYAKVFISAMAMENDAKAIMKGIKSAGGYLRSELAKRLQLRYTPELIFTFDDSIQYGAKINEIIAGFDFKEQEEEHDNE